MPASAESMVRRIISEMCNEPHPELVDELVRPEYRAVGPALGRDVARWNIARMHHGFSDLALKITHVAAEGSRVALRFEWVARTTVLSGGSSRPAERFAFARRASSGSRMAWSSKTTLFRMGSARASSSACCRRIFGPTHAGNH